MNWTSLLGARRVFAAVLVFCALAQASEAPKDKQDATASGASIAAHDRQAAAMQLLERTRAKIEELRSVKARFVQEKHLSMLTAPVVSKGEFFYKAGRKFSWHYFPPDESFTISDGTRIWLYFPALKQAEVYDTQRFKTRSRTFEKLCLGFERPLCDLADAFSIELTAETQADFEVLLRPREEVLARVIAELRILISKETGLPVRFYSTEKNDDWTSISFTETEVNQDIADSVFSFVAPAGVTADEKHGPSSY
ncbi:MAG: outer membrane lipoprotein carrier protein LolA [Candidatus Coatesbacteria bacterium]|nr:outer membrane lipoprotein carrier protein LolA [Candidatus Coatesbacteria bacterium]